MKISPELFAAILHGEWMRWAQQVRHYMNEEGEAWIDSLSKPFDQLRPEEQADFLTAGTAMSEMVARESVPNV